MIYRPDESLPEGVSVRELVMCVLGMALVAVLFLMVTSEPRRSSPDQGVWTPQTVGEPVPVTFPRVIR